VNFQTRYITYFLAVADLRSFSRAAESLGVSQPVLSLRIQLEEKKFGFEVFDRSRRSVALTREGEILISALRELQGSVVRTGKVIDELHSRQARPLLIGLSITSDYPERTQLLADFMAAHPDYRIEQVAGNSLPLLARLQDGSLDIVVSVTPHDPRFDAIVLKRFSPEALVPQELPLAKCKEIGPEMLTGQSIAVFDRSRHPLLYDTFIAPIVKAGALANVSGDDSASGVLAYAVRRRMIMVSHHPRYSDENLIVARMKRVPLRVGSSAALTILRPHGATTDYVRKFWNFARQFAVGVRGIS